MLSIVSVMVGGWSLWGGLEGLLGSLPMTLLLTSILASILFFLWASIGNIVCSDSSVLFLGLPLLIRVASASVATAGSW